jgi:hypothetical protein
MSRCITRYNVVLKSDVIVKLDVTMQYTLWQSSSQVGCHDASLVVSVRQFVLNVISKFSPFNECRTKAANSTFSHFMPVVFAQLICVFCLSLVQ